MVKHEQEKFGFHSITASHATEVAGAVSGFGTRLITQPFDVLKIRFQLQVEPVHAGTAAAPAKYRGVLHAVRTIVHDEGLFALWKGHVPAQTLSILYGLVQFSAYERCRRLLTASDMKKNNLPSSKREIVSPSVWLNLACGGVAGGTASLATFPLDLLRTRLVAQGDRVYLTTLTQTIRETYAAGGLLSFFNGLSAALIAVMPYTAVTFATYGVLRHINTEAKSQRSGGTTFQLLHALKSILCGSVAGVVGKTCVYPLDLVKKRMQMRGFEQVRDRYTFGASYSGQNNSMVNCLIWTAKHEGVMRGLYKGYAPSCLKAATSGAASFFFYELAFGAIKKIDVE